MEMVGKPILLAALTTMAGFISLAWTDITAMRQMGIFVTLGIGYAGFMALFFVPAVLSKLNVSAKHTESGSSFMNRFVLGAARFRYVIPAVFAVIVAVSAVFIPRLEVESNQLMFFKESSEIRQTFAKVEATFGGAMPLTGEAVNTKGIAALLDAQYAGEILTLERDMETLPGVKSVFSVFDMVKGVNLMTTGQDAYPADPAFIQQLAGQFGGSGSLDTWSPADGIA
jgi:predicted RND superfamily exporter protein